MEKDNRDKNYIAEVLASLDERGLSLIDFDSLKQWLEAAASRWEHYDRVTSELAVISEDYRQRVVGMIKALAAVDRKRDGWKQALEFIDSLDNMSGDELVETYRKTAARFRDAFPASFGYLKNGNTTTTAERTFENYK